jgi:NDP-sugar pyrophosphorylase family protein
MSEVRQAVLLAAGAGTRLLPLTRRLPKCLVPLAGVPLVDHLLGALAAAGLDLDELVVVTGWQGEPLRRHLGDRRGRMRVRYVDNPAFATTNNIVSLARAAPLVRPPFALLESDVVIRPAAVRPLARPDTVLVSRYTDGMSGTGARAGAGGRVTELVLAAHRAPREVRATLLKTVNLASFSAATWACVRHAIGRWITSGRTGAFYEAPIAELVAAGAVDLHAVEVAPRDWQEIDDEVDLARAAAVFFGRAGVAPATPAPRATDDPAAVAG